MHIKPTGRVPAHPVPRASTSHGSVGWEGTVVPLGSLRLLALHQLFSSWECSPVWVDSLGIAGMRDPWS